MPWHGRQFVAGALPDRRAARVWRADWAVFAGSCRRQAASQSSTTWVRAKGGNATSSWTEVHTCRPMSASGKLRREATISLTDSITPSRGGQSQPIRPSGRHHDPDRLPAWAAGGRGLRPSLGSDELRWRGASRPEGQERHPEHASLAWRRTASAATASAREQAVTFVFVSERGSPFTTAGFARMVERVAKRGLGLELTAHPHMLRHACGHSLANKGHDTRAIQGWLGHRSIMSTAVDTALAPNRFRDFWRE